MSKSILIAVMLGVRRTTQALDTLHIVTHITKCPPQ